MKARFQLRCPVWNNPLCPRLSGLLDGGLHKARVQSGPEGERLYSGRVRVQGERFKVFEAQVEQQLLAAAAPPAKRSRAAGLGGAGLCGIPHRHHPVFPPGSTHRRRTPPAR